MARPLCITLVFAATLVALAGAAAVQEAGSLFDGLKDQFTIVLPEGWSVYDLEAALTGKPGLYGIVFFSAEPVMVPGEKMANPDFLEASREVFLSEGFQKAERGDVPSFFVDRHPAGKGMSCSRLTKSARSQIELMVRNDPAIGGPGRGQLAQFNLMAGIDPPLGGLERQMIFLPKSPRRSLIRLAGCQALKLEGKGKDGSEKWRRDVRAVSDGKTLYLFSLRSTADNFARNLGAYEAALATLRLSPERKTQR